MNTKRGMKTIRRILDWFGFWDYCQTTRDRHDWTQWSAVDKSHNIIYQARRCKECGFAEIKRFS